MKGTYLLVMELQNETSLQVGKLGSIDFKKGSYVYVGSALNGLEQRIQRHLRRQKKSHWHIDYFLPYTEIIDIFYQEGTRKEECKIAEVFENNVTSIPGFGCSDCSCAGHLFYGPSGEINTLINSMGMNSYFVEPNP